MTEAGPGAPSPVATAPSSTTSTTGTAGSARRAPDPRALLASLSRQLTAATVDFGGSTRSLAIFRVLVVGILWTRFSWDLFWPRAKSPSYLVASVLFFAVTPLLLVGFKTRVVAWITSGTLVFMLVQIAYREHHEPWTHHHVAFLVILTALLALTPCGRSLSVDRVLAVRRARREGRAIPDENGPLWAVRMMQMTVTSLYLYGAIDKMRWSYVSGARLHHYFMESFGNFPLPMTGLAGSVVDATFAVVAVSSIALELSLAFLLYVPRVQVPLMIAGALFHLLIYVTLPVSTFSATTVLAYVLFFPPARVHAFVDDALGQRSTDDEA